MIYSYTGSCRTGNSVAARSFISNLNARKRNNISTVNINSCYIKTFACIAAGNSPSYIPRSACRAIVSVRFTCIMARASVRKTEISTAADTVFQCEVEMAAVYL